MALTCRFLEPGRGFEPGPELYKKRTPSGRASISAEALTSGDAELFPSDAGRLAGVRDRLVTSHHERRVAAEPSWWGDQDAAEERRALTEAFRVEELEAATADLRARCDRLERSRSSGEVVTVGDVAEVLLGQWSVAFHARLADSQRAFCWWGDHDRLARAAEDGCAAAVAVRDRYLAPERISGHSLQQALNLANVHSRGMSM